MKLIRAQAVVAGLGFMLALLSAPYASSSGETADTPSLQDFVATVCAADPMDGVTTEFCGMAIDTIRARNDDGVEVDIPVLVAAHPAERGAGYQYIAEDIIQQTAMLFVFTSEQRGAFHMCNVTAPLEIAWIRNDGSILDMQVMEPGPMQAVSGCPALYAPESPGTYRFVLEAGAGFLQSLGIGASTRFFVEP